MMWVVLIASAFIAVVCWVRYYQGKKAEEFFAAQRDYLHVTEYDNFKG